VALGDWSTWMKWKREESKKKKGKAKVDMYLVSFGLESSWECLHQSSPFTWPRLTLTLGLRFAS